MGLWLFGCSDGPSGPIIPDPPQVEVSLPQPSVAGLRFPVQITVSGCEFVDKVELFDDQTLLRTLTWSGNPLSVELEPNEIPYRTVAARPLFRAKVFCTDGRYNTSA